MQTEFTFSLPRGYIDPQGNVHQQGTMRLATVMDEIAPLSNPVVRTNEAYLTLLVLSQVITSLGTLRDVTPATLENCFAVDVAYLQDFYSYINGMDEPDYVSTHCPNCGHHFDVEIPPLGGVE